MTLEIMEALNGLIVEAIGEIKAVYYDLVPENFMRPCLLIETVTESPQDAAEDLLRVTEFLTLTIFDQTDDYAKTGTRTLIALRDRVMGLLRRGYLTVGGRNLKITVSTAGRDWDKAYIDLTIEYYRTRGQKEEDYPLMEELEFKLEE